MVMLHLAKKCVFFVVVFHFVLNDNVNSFKSFVKKSSSCLVMVIYSKREWGGGWGVGGGDRHPSGTGVLNTASNVLVLTYNGGIHS